MAKRRAAWTIVALAMAGAWAAGCEGNPAAPGESTFRWTVTPGQGSSLRVQRGAAGTFAIRLDSKVNINSDVSLGFTGSLPPNSTATFVPERLASTARDAVFTIQTTSQTPISTYPLTITATEVGYPGTYTASIRLDVVAGEAPDFLLEVDPADITLSPGRGGPTVAFRITPINGFGGTVNISVDGLEAPPAPVTIAVPVTPSVLTFAPGDPSRGGTFVPDLAQRSSYPATWTLTLRAVSGAIVHTRTINITIRSL